LPSRAARITSNRESSIFGFWGFFFGFAFGDFLGVEEARLALRLRESLALSFKKALASSTAFLLELPRLPDDLFVADNKPKQKLRSDN